MNIRLAINVLVGVGLGLLFSYLLSGCSDERPLAPPPSAGMAAEATHASETALAPTHATAREAADAQPAHTRADTSARRDATNSQAANNADAAMPLPQTSERYHLSWDGKLEGDAERRLSCDGRQCRFETHAKVVGLASLSEVSDFNWQNGQVQFQRYERTLQLLFKQVVRIEKQADGSIRSERRNKIYTYASQPGLVDILNIEVQLRADRVAGRAPKASYPLADSKGVSAIQLRREADATLTIAGQARPCEVYVREDGKRVTTLWLDPAQAFLPLQIVHQDGAETYRMQWLGD